MNDLLKGRDFQFWEYNVSHGSLLVRSPKQSENESNVDIKFFGIKYVSLPRHLKKISLTDASEKEIKTLETILGNIFDTDNVYVLESYMARHLIVSAGIKIEKNETDIFDSPFD